MSKIVAALVTWYQGEPLVAHNVAAFALTVLAHYGVHLDANTTALVGSVLAATATGLTHRKVAPVAPASPGESGASEIVPVLVTVVAVLLVCFVFGVNFASR